MQVYSTDHAATDNNHGLGNLRHLEILIAIDDVAIVKRDQGRAGGFRPGRDNNFFRLVIGLATHPGHTKAVGACETGKAGENFDSVA